MTEPYSDTGDRITPLFNLPSRHGVVQAVRIDYAPGGYTPGSHRHPAGAHVHVLDGAVRMGIDDEPARVLSAGDSLYEAPDQVHSVSANASDTAPATLIAFFVLAEDEPSTVVDA